MLYGSFFMPELFSKTVIAIKQNVVYLIVCGSVFFACAILGVFFARSSEDVLLYDSACGFLDIVFKPSVSVWKYVFSKFFGGAGLLIIVTVCGLTVWLVPIHVLLIGYFAFVSGIAAVAFYGALSVVGVGFYILILFPSTVIRAGAIAVLSVNLIYYFKERENLKCSGEKNSIEISRLLLYFALSLAMYFVAVMFEALCLIVIVRPINIYF